MDRALVSEIEQVVSDPLDTLCSRVSNLVASRKPGGLGESVDSEDQHRTTIAAPQTAMDILTPSPSLTITANPFHKNKPLRVHELPPDILIPTLLECLPVISRGYNRWMNDMVKSAFRDYFVQLYLLRRVCSAWRDVIDDHPPFWAYISPECPESVVAEALRRSKTAPLFVSDTPGVEEADYIAFMHKISQHAYRWKTMVLDHIPSTDIARSTLCVPAPTLRVAVLRASYEEGAPPLIHLFAGQAERLRTLIVFALPVQWSSSFLANLQSFTISGHWRTPSGISQRGLLQLIAEMPHLEDLEISDPTLDYDGDTGISISKDVTPIVLRHLQHLKISELNGNLVHTFLKRFRIPACRDLFLYHDSPSPSDSLPEELFEAARHIILPALQGNKTSSISLSAQNDADDFNWHSSHHGDAFTFQLIFQGLPHHRCIWLMDQFYSGVSSDISLDLPDSAILSDLSLLSCLAKWQTITSITLWSGHNAGSFLQYLTQPTIERGGSFAWPFEGLRCLRLFDKMDCGQELYEFIKTRWQTPQSTSKENTNQSSFSLSLIYIDSLGLTEDQLNEIGNFLDEENE